MTDLRRVAYDLWANAAKRADVRNVEFTITRDWTEQQIATFCETNHHSFAKGDPFRPSLDRLRFDEGYTPENIRVVWLIENLARNRFSEDELIEFCKRKLGLM